MAGRTSTDSSVPELPPHAEVATDLTGVNRLPEPPTEIPPSPPKLQKEESAERVLIWRAEVNASTPTCACSLMTRRQPVTAWCPECAGPFEGLQYTRFKDGEGLTRFPSGRRSVANVWAIFSPRDSDPGNLPRLAPRGTDHLFSVNEFAVYGRRLLHKTKLDRVFGGGSKKRERERYARPEYGDLPGSVAEMEPEYDPPKDPAALMGPNAAYDSPALDARMRRQPPAKLGAVNTEMYRSLRASPVFYWHDRPSVSSLLDEWSSSGGDDDCGKRGKPKLTIDATAERLRRAQRLLYSTSGKPATSPPPNIRPTPALGATKFSKP